MKESVQPKMKPFVLSYTKKKKKKKKNSSKLSRYETLSCIYTDKALQQYCHEKTTIRNTLAYITTVALISTAFHVDASPANTHSFLKLVAFTRVHRLIQ